MHISSSIPSKFTKPIRKDDNNNILLSDNPLTWSECFKKEQRDELLLKGPASLLKTDNEYPKNTQKRHFSNNFQYRRV